MTLLLILLNIFLLVSSFPSASRYYPDGWALSPVISPTASGLPGLNSRFSSPGGLNFSQFGHDFPSPRLFNPSPILDMEKARQCALQLVELGSSVTISMNNPVFNVTSKSVSPVNSASASQLASAADTDGTSQRKRRIVVQTNASALKEQAPVTPVQHAPKMVQITQERINTLKSKCRCCQAIAVRIAMRTINGTSHARADVERADKRARKHVPEPSVSSHLICQVCQVILCRSCAVLGVYDHPLPGTFKKGAGLREDFDDTQFESFDNFRASIKATD